MLSACVVNASKIEPSCDQLSTSFAPNCIQEGSLFSPARPGQTKRILLSDALESRRYGFCMRSSRIQVNNLMTAVRVQGSDSFQKIRTSRDELQQLWIAFDPDSKFCTPFITCGNGVQSFATRPSHSHDMCNGQHLRATQREKHESIALKWC